MKKFFLPIALMLSCVLASCSADDDFIVDDDQDFSSWTADGVPAWLDKGFTAVYSDGDIYTFGKYLLSSNSDAYYMHWEIVKVHELNSKQYVSLSAGSGSPNVNSLIFPNKPSGTETIIRSEASIDIRQLGYYDIVTKCFTPGGKEITNEKLIQQILSSPARIIYCDQYGCFGKQTDRIYGLDNYSQWFKPQHEDGLRTMCEDRFNQYGDSYFWGAIEFYTYKFKPEGETYYYTIPVTEEHTNGRGLPFALETFIMNGDHTFTRHIESFIATEDGKIISLPFEDVKEIMMSEFGYTDYDPFKMLRCAK